MPSSNSKTEAVVPVWHWKTWDTQFHCFHDESRFRSGSTSMTPYLRFRVLPGNADLACVFVYEATVPLVSRTIERCQFHLICLSPSNLYSLTVPVVDNLSGKYGPAFHINADLISIFALVISHTNLKAPRRARNFHREVPEALTICQDSADCHSHP